MAASVSGITGANGTMSSLREMVMEVFLNLGGSESEMLVAMKVCATTPREASSTHAARQRRMYDTDELIMAVVRRTATTTRGQWPEYGAADVLDVRW